MIPRSARSTPSRAPGRCSARNSTAHPPALVVDDSRGKPHAPDRVSSLRRLLAAGYEESGTVDGAVLHAGMRAAGLTPGATPLTRLALPARSPPVPAQRLRAGSGGPPYRPGPATSAPASLTLRRSSRSAVTTRTGRTDGSGRIALRTMRSSPLPRPPPCTPGTDSTPFACARHDEDQLHRYSRPGSRSWG